jgi:hypothetical protein
VAVRGTFGLFPSEIEKEIEMKLKEINTAHKFEKFEFVGCD